MAVPANGTVNETRFGVEQLLWGKVDRAYIRIKTAEVSCSAEGSFAAMQPLTVATKTEAQKASSEFSRWRPYAAMQQAAAGEMEPDADIMAG